MGQARLRSPAPPLGWERNTQRCGVTKQGSVTAATWNGARAPPRGPCPTGPARHPHAAVTVASPAPATPSRPSPAERAQAVGKSLGQPPR